MKKILLAGAVALFGLSNAQIAKGTKYLSGTVNYASTENKNDNTTVQDLKLVPTIGYFVGTNLAVGVGVGYASTSDKVENGAAFAKTSMNAVVVEPFVRKYWSLGDKLFFFGQLAVPMQFGNAKFENNAGTTKENFNAVGVTIKPGLDYFVGKNWAIEATLGEFGYSNYKFKNAKAVNSYNFGLDLASVGLGVKYVFAK